MGGNRLGGSLEAQGAAIQGHRGQDVSEMRKFQEEQLAELGAKEFERE